MDEHVFSFSNKKYLGILRKVGIYHLNQLCILCIMSQRPREGYFGVYFSSCDATREIKSKIALG